MSIEVQLEKREIEIEMAAIDIQVARFFLEKEKLKYRLQGLTDLDLEREEPEDQMQNEVKDVEEELKPKRLKK